MRVAFIVLFGLLALGGCTDVSDPDPRRKIEPTAPGPSLPRIIRPGRLGPLVVGMSQERAVTTGLLVEASLDGACSNPYETIPQLQDRGVFASFAREGERRLIGISVTGRGSARPVGMRTRAGAKVGTTAEELRRLYGRLPYREFEGHGGNYGARVLFGIKGALMFIFRLNDEGSPRRRVSEILMTSGTSLDDVRGLTFC